MIIKSQKDFFSGLMFLVVGLAFAVGSRNYSIGEAARMGPGYFPMMLGILLAVLGAAITARALVVAQQADGDRIGQWAWRPLFFVVASNLVFGVLLAGLPSIGLPAMGLVAAIFALIFFASLAGEEFNLKEVLILSAVLSLGSYLTFVVVLKLQFVVWPAFITG